MKSKTTFLKVILTILALFVISGCSNTEDPTKDPIVKDPPVKEEVKYGSYEATLIAGYYTAGIDFPTGKYDLVAQSGMGNVMCLDTLPIGLNIIMGNPITEGFSIADYNNAEFKKGDVLSVTSSLVLKINSDKALLSGVEKRVNPATETVELSSGNYVSGVDFKAGVYDIIAVSGTGNVICLDSFVGSVNAIMGEPVTEGFSINKYNNVPFEDGYTLTVSGVTIKLVPSK